MSATMTATATVTAVAGAEDATERIPSVPMSRGLKIEDLAAAPGGSGDQAEASQLFSVDALVHAVSGSVGGNVAMLAFYPLDQLVMRAQAATGKGKSGGPIRAMMDVIATEGVSGLYRGLGSTLVTLFAANFIYFYAFHLMRAVARRNQRLRSFGKMLGISRAVSNLLLGTIAGAINVCFVQPLWVANARLKLQGGEYKGTCDVILRIIREEGYDKLWAGVSSSLLLCCNPAIQFAVYETVKKILVARKAQGGKARRLSGIEAFVLGAVAKWIATVATYPLQVAQTRLRFGKCSTRPEYAGTFDCLRKIYASEGRSGLYRGMETKLWHSTLISALMFLSYEKIQLAVQRAMRNSAAANPLAHTRSCSVSSTPPASPVLNTGNACAPSGPRSSSPPFPPPPLTSTSSYNSLATLDASAQAAGGAKAKFE